MKENHFTKGVIMEITVLVDNNTLIDRYFKAEPGLSVFIEDTDYRILFDVGYSGLFLENAAKMGIDLSRTDSLVLSHSHLDHTWGLDSLIRFYAELEIEKRPFKRPELVCHPLCLTRASADGFNEFGNLFSPAGLEKHFHLRLDKAPVFITDNLIFLGEIPRLNHFEGKLTFGKKDGCDMPDAVPEDSALVCRTKEGLVIVTGCSHAGICNIVDHAVNVCNDSRILDIIGGFHLQNPSKNQLEQTIRHLEKVSPKKVHACHCTDLTSKIAMADALNIMEVGVGLKLVF